MKHRQMLKACQRYPDTHQKNRSIDREVELDTNATSTNITLILGSAMYQCRSREIWHHTAPIPGPRVQYRRCVIRWGEGESLCARVLQSGCDASYQRLELSASKWHFPSDVSSVHLQTALADRNVFVRRIARRMFYMRRLLRSSQWSVLLMLQAWDCIFLGWDLNDNSATFFRPSWDLLYHTQA
jgi:hypothetical protein